jgi:hypothetical protein
MGANQRGLQLDITQPKAREGQLTEQQRRIGRVGNSWQSLTQQKKPPDSAAPDPVIKLIKLPYSLFTY